MRLKDILIYTSAIVPLTIGVASADAPEWARRTEKDLDAVAEDMMKKMGDKLPESHRKAYAELKKAIKELDQSIKDTDSYFDKMAESKKQHDIRAEIQPKDLEYRLKHEHSQTHTGYKKDEVEKKLDDVVKKYHEANNKAKKADKEFEVRKYHLELEKELGKKPIKKESGNMTLDQYRASVAENIPNEYKTKLDSMIADVKAHKKLSRDSYYIAMKIDETLQDIEYKYQGFAREYTIKAFDAAQWGSIQRYLMIKENSRKMQQKYK